MSEQKRCPECDCDFEKVKCNCAEKISAEAYYHSLLVEQNVSACETEIKIKKLPTKSELMAEMQAHADYIRNGYTGKLSIRIEKDKHLNQLWFMFESFSLGNAMEYRLDPIAPVKGITVISKSGRLWVSAGELDGDMLNVFDYSELEEISCLRHWCDYFDRSHHSPGWRKEWEPSE